MTGSWQPVADTIELHPDVVHVWRSSLDVGEGGEAALLCLLSSEEKARAEKYSFEKPRRDWIVSRGLLRSLLTRLSGEDACDHLLTEDEKGKPRLGGTCGQGRIRFNLSHSGDLWVCAVALHREVGIDVERSDADRPHERLARRFFSPAEREALLSLPAEELPAGFLRCWTRKEAFLKAKGFGITIPLDSFDVTLAPGDPPAVVATRFDPDEAERWSMMDLDVGAGFAGALCVEGDEPEVRLWDWGAA